MSSEIRDVAKHTFNGGRFEDHGIDLDAMQEVQRYRDLLVEVAKELWRRNHPKRQRLPRNFDEAFALRFYSIESNCATIPLVRKVMHDEQPNLWPFDDELDRAVHLVTETIHAASEDSSLPDEFPKRLLHLFEDYGKSLRDDEWMEQRPARSELKSRYDLTAKTRLTKWISESYTDQVAVVGEVTMARVNRPRMAIEVDGAEIEAEFRAEDEETITTALRDHSVAKLQVIGKGRFNADGVLEKIIEVQEVVLLAEGKLPFDHEAKPIWDQFAEISATIPDDQLEKLPKDGSSRLDDYIYGDNKEE